MNIDQPQYVDGHQLLAGKTVLITAAAGAGIGFAAAKRALEEGCSSLLISDIHEQRLAEALTTLQALKPDIQIDAKVCNVTSEQDVQALVDFAVQKMQRIDVLINNAGLGTSCALLDMSDEEWDKVIQVTLYGAMRMMRATLRIMREQARGVIVNNTSVLGWRAQKNQSHYAAAKAAVMALTRCAALEAAEFGVRINAVAPSLAMHPMLVKSAPAELLASLQEQEAYGRGAEPWEVANVMMFLASDYASYLTGENISCSSQHA